FLSRVSLMILVVMTGFVATDSVTTQADVASKPVPAKSLSVIVPNSGTQGDCEAKLEKATPGTGRAFRESADVSGADDRYIAPFPVKLREVSGASLISVPQINLSDHAIRTAPERINSERKASTRREQRMVSKKLWQDQLKKNLKPFINGNEPYVVPLIGNNF
ncbi:MAG TPA: hypothetical protein VEB86_07105, partial [Chryseosolibacter sp.]|nr:hypothetical protein [Chryseosolibacter sp.]